MIESTRRSFSRREFVAGLGTAAAALATCRLTSAAAPAGVHAPAILRGADGIELPKLPYAEDALAPVISANTIGFHYGKHHKGYVDNLNKMIAEKEKGFAGWPLDKIVAETAGKPEKAAVFNNAAQIWNHTFYWNGLSPKGGGDPKGALGDALSTSFGSAEAFRKKFTEAALGHFGSGWAWLVKKKDGALDVVQTHDAGCPLADGQTPLLDVSLAGFAPGEYLIELAASGSGGDAKELVGFRVTG